MKTHQGYETKKGIGAKCSKCGDLIECGEEAVHMEPVEITEDGSVQGLATAIHGVVHLSCFKEL